MSTGCCTVISEDFGWDDEVFLSFLPLSHAYEHTGGQHFPIGLGAQIYYAEGLEKLASNIEEVRPTIMVVVPRLFEVLRTRIVKAIEKQGKLSNYLLGRAVSIGGKKAAGGVPIYDQPMNLIVKSLLMPKISKRFGGRIKAMVSGGAPLNPEIGIFFQSLGLTFLQGYGQTEAAPVISCNRPTRGPQDGHGRPAAAQHRSADRRGRRNPGARRTRHARLLAQPRGNRARAPGRLAPHRRRRDDRRSRAGSRSPTARRT